MLLDNYEVVTPEVTIKTTIANIKNNLRLLQDEMNRLNEVYNKNMQKLELQKVEFQKSMEAWQKLLEKINA